MYIKKVGMYIKSEEETGPLSFSFTWGGGPLSIFVLGFRKGCFLEILSELLRVHKTLAWKELERRREEVMVHPN